MPFSVRRSTTRGRSAHGCGCVRVTLESHNREGSFFFPHHTHRDALLHPLERYGRPSAKERQKDEPPAHEGREAPEAACEDAAPVVGAWQQQGWREGGGREEGGYTFEGTLRVFERFGGERVVRGVEDSAERRWLCEKACMGRKVGAWTGRACEAGGGRATSVRASGGDKGRRNLSLYERQSGGQTSAARE